MMCSTWPILYNGVPLPESKFRSAIGRSYKIGLTFGSLALIVLYWSVVDHRIGICPGHHYPISPQTPKIVEIPCEEFAPLRRVT